MLTSGEDTAVAASEEFDIDINEWTYNVFWVPTIGRPVEDDAWFAEQFRE